MGYAFGSGKSLWEDMVVARGIESPGGPEPAVVWGTALSVLGLIIGGVTATTLNGNYKALGAYICLGLGVVGTIIFAKNAWGKVFGVQEAVTTVLDIGEMSLGVYSVAKWGG